MTTATARIQTQLLNNRANFHSSRNNNLLALWMRASANHFSDVYNNLVEVERFLDRQDEDIHTHNMSTDDSREFDRDRYGYERVDDFRSFKSSWTDYLEENEDNLEW